MNKFIKLIVLGMLLLPSFVKADNEVSGTVLTAASGTTSATVFVPPAPEFLNVTDLQWRLDSGVTTGIIIFRSGDIQYSSTSATSASGSVVWFTNAGTSVAAGEFIIVYDESAGSYFLRQTTAATTTSVTVSESISPALTTSDKVWSVVGSFSRPVPSNTSNTMAPGNLWLPRNVPTAVTIDGNTTACRISLSGVRSNYR